MTFKVRPCLSHSIPPVTRIDTRGNENLQEALHIVSRNLFLQLMFPMWVLRWGTPHMRNFYTASNELQVRRLVCVHVSSASGC